MARLSPRAAPRQSPRAAPRHRRLPAWCVCVTHRGCLAPMPARLAACAAGLRPPPTRPAAWEAGSGCKFLNRETKRKAGPQPSPPGPI